MRRVGFAGLIACLWAGAADAQPPQQTPYANPPPLIAGARFHHVHINTVDPKRAVAFYTKHFDARAATFAGQPAVFAQASWLLFDKVSRKAPIALNTAIWHIGWGAPDPKAEFVRQQGLGADVFQPLTDISTGLGGRPDRFYYMYLQSPDRTLIELNTARTDDFGHMHMFSADPIAAGDWYIRFFGVTGRALSTPTIPPRTPRMSLLGLQVGPSSSLYFDNVNMIIYPVEYAKKAYAADWKGISGIQSTRGNVNDHFAVSVPYLDAALKVFRANGVKVTSRVKTVRGQYRAAFIEGPDRVAIEIIEDRTPPPFPPG